MQFRRRRWPAHRSRIIRFRRRIAVNSPHARDRAKTIRKAARVAAFNGWTTAAAAAFSAMFLVFDRSPLSIAVTLGLSIVAYNEFRGRKRLLNFDPERRDDAGLESTRPAGHDRRLLPVDAQRKQQRSRWRNDLPKWIARPGKRC